MEQIRKLRATLNKALQACSSVEAIKSYGAEFECLFGASIWGCNCKGIETFADLYNAHMQRERENEEYREEEAARCANIIKEIGETSTEKEWRSCFRFVDCRPLLYDNQNILDALEERRMFHDIPEEE